MKQLSLNDLSFQSVILQGFCLSWIQFCSLDEQPELPCREQRQCWTAPSRGIGLESGCLPLQSCSFAVPASKLWQLVHLLKLDLQSSVPSAPLLLSSCSGVAICLTHLAEKWDFILIINFKFENRGTWEREDEVPNKVKNKL